MATQTIERAKYSNGPFNMVTRKEAASQSFKVGEFVYLVSGKVTSRASDAVVIYGMAEQDASGTTDTELLIRVPNEQTEFEMNVYHATAASAITAITNYSYKYALYVASNIHYVDIGDTSYDAFVITDILVGGNKSIGDTYGRVKVKILPEVLQDGAKAT